MHFAVVIFILTGMIVFQPHDGGVSLAPWECLSDTLPRNEDVIRKEGDLYVYECEVNG